MSESRKRGSFNERVKMAHERKEIIEENRRIQRMEREASMSIQTKRKRANLRMLMAFAAGAIASGPRLTT